MEKPHTDFIGRTPKSMIPVPQNVKGTLMLIVTPVRKDVEIVLKNEGRWQQQKSNPIADG